MTTKPKPKPAPEGAIVTSWRGYTRYECTECAFDTLNQQVFEDHYRLAHTSLESHATESPAFEQAPPPAGETPVED